MSDGQPTTQSKYRKRKKSEIQPIIDANEVRIKGNQGHVKRYVDYACSLLEGRRVINLQEDEHGNVQTPDSKQEDEASSEPTKFDTIVLKATGRAINKAVTTAEVVKRRIADLHQITALDTLEITDEWEPLEQGLKVVETKRRVASITITLSRDEEALKAHQDYSTGYQVPICSDNIKPYIMQQTRPSPRRNRGGGYGRRGGRGRRDNRDNGRRNDRMDRDEDNYDRPRRGRGGRGPRGGGYGGRGPGGGYDRPRGGGGGYGGRGPGGYGGGPRGGRYGGGGGGPRDSGGRFDRDHEDRMGYGGGRRGRGSPRGPRGYGGPPPRGRGRGPASRYDDSGY